MHACITCKNTGKTKLTISEAIVTTMVGGRPYKVEETTFNPNEQMTIRILSDWAPGVEYTIDLITTNGNKFSYTATAPRT